VKEENESRPESRNYDRHSDGRQVTLLELTSGDENCGHPPDAVNYLGDDGRNLYFECSRCSATLVASDALHLLD